MRRKKRTISEKLKKITEKWQQQHDGKLFSARRRRRWRGGGGGARGRRGDRQEAEAELLNGTRHRGKFVEREKD